MAQQEESLPEHHNSYSEREATESRRSHLSMEGQNSSDMPGSSTPLNHHRHDESSSLARHPTTTWREYWCSWRLGELLLSFVPAILGGITEVAFNPRQRQIPYQYLENSGEYVRNQVYNETFEGETVPTLMLVMVTGWLPLILQYLIIQFCSARGIGHWELVHKTLCVYVAAIGTTVLLTNSIKLYVGYLRPIFYDQCQPIEDYTVCTADDNEGNTDERQLRLSFPSGHASMSVCGMLVFSKFLEQRFGMYKDLYQQYYSKPYYDTNHNEDTDAEMGYNHQQQHPYMPRSPRNVGLGRIVSLLCYSPMLVALFVAASRVVDNKHFPADVVGGSLLGGTVAHLVFSIWFPSWEQLLLGG